MKQKPEEFRMGISDKDESATVSEGSTTKTDSDTETETDEDCRSARDSPPFQLGELVSIPDTKYNKVWEARVLKCDYEKERYYIHYMGWTKRYDRWVEANRLVKKKLGTEKNTELGDISTRKPNTSVGRGKKRKNNAFDKEKADVPSEELTRLEIPLPLKTLLINDHESINRFGKLVTLPRYPTVDVILKKYLDYRSQKSGKTSKSAEEIMCGLRSYFDKALQMMLLYKKERRQFANAIGKEPPSKVYGAEHLLRLFVKLPELLTRANIEKKTLKELQEVVGDLLMFLKKNRKDYFQPKYCVLADAETSTNK